MLLMASCSDPQAEALKELTARGYSLSPEQFFKAASTGDAAALKLFLAAGMAPGVRDARGRDALKEAVTHGRLAAVDVLLANGAASAVQKGNDLLVEAVRSHQVPVLHALLDAGVKADTEPKTSPLVVAAQEQQKEMVDLLAPFCAGHVQAALIAAAETGDVAVLSCLLRNGAQVTARDAATERTPLIIAAARGYSSEVEMLLASGSDRMAVDGAGRSALDLAREGGHEDVVRRLGQQVTDDELLCPASVNGQVLKMGPLAEVAPDSQLVLLGCHEETFAWQLDAVEESAASLRMVRGTETKKLELEQGIPATDWTLKTVLPAGMFARPAALFRDRDTWKHLLLVQGIPARRGRLCAWLQLTADGTVFEAGVGDRFSAAGQRVVPILVKEVTPVQVVLVNEADAGQTWVLKPGGMR